MAQTFLRAERLSCHSIDTESTVTVTLNKYAGPPNCRAEIYAGRVASCLLMSHGEYADGTDRQTDRRKNVTSLLSAMDAASVINRLMRYPRSTADNQVKALSSHL